MLVACEGERECGQSNLWQRDRFSRRTRGVALLNRAVLLPEVWTSSGLTGRKLISNGPDCFDRVCSHQ